MTRRPRLLVVLALAIAGIVSLLAGSAGAAPGDATATQVADIDPGFADSFPDEYTNIGGTVYFTAFSAAVGQELWRTDGTTTTVVEDGVPGGGINPSTASSSPGQLINVNGTLFFSADDGSNGNELWKLSGSTATMVEDAVPLGGIRPGSAPSNPDDLTNVNGTLFFRATDGSNGQELWKYDGTTATMVEDSVPLGGINPGGASSSPQFFTNVNGTLFFRATDGSNGFELWKYDGTTATMIEDSVPLGGINPSGADSNPASLTNVNGTLFFQATDGTNGIELWKYDGTTASMIGINPAGSSDPFQLTNVNGTLFFIANDGTTGEELWKSDGTTATLVEDAVPGGGINPAGDALVGSLTNVNGTLFFSANDGTNGQELWKVSTSTATMIEDAVPGGGINPAGHANPQTLTNVNGTLFFMADDGSNGFELWKTDGGTATMIEDAIPGGGISPGVGSSVPGWLTNVNGTLFFQADDGSNGFELWKFSGSTATMVEDGVPGGGINPGVANSIPEILTNVNGVLFFRANDGTTGVEPWRATIEGPAQPPIDNPPVLTPSVLTPQPAAVPPRKKCKKKKKGAAAAKKCKKK